MAEWEDSGFAIAIAGDGCAGHAGAAPVAPVAAPDAGNAISTSVFCAGVNRSALSPSANSDLAYAVLQNLTNNPYFTDKSAFGLTTSRWMKVPTLLPSP